MVITVLDEKLIKSGEKLLRKLDEANVVIDAALWLYFDENQVWKLLLSLPNIILRGPEVAYETVQKVLLKIDNPSFALNDITIANPDSPILALIRQSINTGNGISGIRFSNNAINGQLIQDAYIYRIMRITPKDKKTNPPTETNNRSR
jgi:hypothetical protein